MPLSSPLSGVSRLACGAAWLVLGALSACSRDGGAPAGGEAGKAPVASAVASLAASAPGAPRVSRVVPPASSAPAHPALCEVEMGGMVKGIPTGKFANIIVSDQDCLAPGARLLGRSGVTREGKFFYEVYTKWGSDLTVCIAVESEPGKPSTVYGKAPRALHAEAAGEVEFKDLEITIAPGPAHVFPTKLVLAQDP